MTAATSSSAGLRIGLFGGSFDPIHNGHVEPIVHACDDLGIDRVFYLPTACPPHKTEQAFAPALARYCMVELALLRYPALLASTYELSLERPAYTVETAEHFALEYPRAELMLFLGADSYLELDQWRRWRELVDRVTLVVLRRPGFSPSDCGWHHPGARVVVLENPPIDLSSTVVRARLRAGERPDETVVPAPVLEYCRKYHLYS